LVNLNKMKTRENSAQSIVADAEVFTFILVEYLSDAAISRVYVSCSTATGRVDSGIARARAVDVRGGVAGARAIDVADATTAAGVLEMNVSHRDQREKGSQHSPRYSHGQRHIP
jgi:hypothetical protein